MKKKGKEEDRPGASGGDYCSTEGRRGILSQDKRGKARGEKESFAGQIPVSGEPMRRAGTRKGGGKKKQKIKKKQEIEKRQILRGRSGDRFRCMKKTKSDGGVENGGKIYANLTKVATEGGGKREERDVSSRGGGRLENE